MNAYLVVMLELDPLVDIPARLQQAEAVGTKDGKHRISGNAVVVVPDKVGFLDVGGGRHQDGLDVHAREHSLRERVSEMPCHLSGVSKVRSGMPIMAPGRPSKRTNL
jgi:hypothetical protein